MFRKKIIWNKCGQFFFVYHWWNSCASECCPVFSWKIPFWKDHRKLNSRTGLLCPWYAQLRSLHEIQDRIQTAGSGCRILAATNTGSGSFIFFHSHRKRKLQSSPKPNIVSLPFATHWRRRFGQSPLLNFNFRHLSLSTMPIEIRS